VKKNILKILVLYKKYLSSGHNCRFIPSCSEYTYDAINKYGVVKGLYLGLKRVLRCHPWGGSGIDLLK
jgi:putative membrane protein insertion efficiency factor